ncbi:MAG: adenosine deaminase family protein [Verrucomicrobia bacterium]|jgi:adenosine deaminase|nr:adenosine deaminase family protein [Verrucomicrobiota bacterium]
MNPTITSEFIRAIPKSDLHVHLDGSLRLGTLIELAKAHGVELPSYEAAGLRELVFKDRYANLGEYLHGFAYTCAVLRDAESIERVACELAEDNIAEGVRYIEVRFAPQLHVRDELQMKDVVGAVAAGLERGAKSHNNTSAVKQGDDIPFEFGIIVCAMRSINEHMSPYYKRLFHLLSGTPHKELCTLASMEMVRLAVELRDKHGLPIVGFDLAGEEAGYPAAYHTQAYQFAHSHFLRKTVHAGEAYGPESIFQAITDCYTNRIGHGTFLFSSEMIQDPNIADKAAYVESLAEYVASQRITMEVCITSNLQTVPEFETINDHPICRMIESSLSVSVCTDNRLISNTTVSRELELIASALCLHPAQFKNLVVAGFKGSFFGGGYNQKRAYVRQMMSLYEKHEQTLLAG